MATTLEQIMSTPIKENDEPLISIRQHSDLSLNVSSEHYLLTGEDDHYVRAGVLDRLKDAEKRLPEGYGLLVLEAYRTIEEQEDRASRKRHELKRQYAHLSGEDIEKETNEYTAEPRGTPPHTTGGAVNVTLLKDGKEAKMGCFYGTIDHRTPTRSTFLIDEEARENRNLLLEAMTAAGFVNNDRKWWHYSHGDQAWAATEGKDHAIYGKAEHPGRK